MEVRGQHRATAALPPISAEQEAGWVAEPVRTFDSRKKTSFASTGIRTPGRPVRRKRRLVNSVITLLTERYSHITKLFDSILYQSSLTATYYKGFHYRMKLCKTGIRAELVQDCSLLQECSQRHNLKLPYIEHPITVELKASDSAKPSCSSRN
jgi:hypothetical protein